MEDRYTLVGWLHQQHWCSTKWLSAACCSLWCDIHCEPTAEQNLTTLVTKWKTTLTAHPNATWLASKSGDWRLQTQGHPVLGLLPSDCSWMSHAAVLHLDQDDHDTLVCSGKRGYTMRPPCVIWSNWDTLKYNTSSPASECDKWTHLLYTLCTYALQKSTSKFKVHAPLAPEMW